MLLQFCIAREELNAVKYTGKHNVDPSGKMTDTNFGGVILSSLHT